jgi:hypothetical protein
MLSARDPMKRRPQSRGTMYEDEEDSLSGSVVSFDPDVLMQSATLSAIQAEESDAESEGSSTPFSPPGWKKEVSGYGRLFNLRPPSTSSREQSRSPDRFGASRSRSTRSQIRITEDDFARSVRSIEEDDHIDDTLLPANVPLPMSPLKRSPRNTASLSPEKYTRQLDDELSSIGSHEREISVQPTEPEDNC